MLYSQFHFLQVCTNIIEKNANPEWNQIIYLQIKVSFFFLFSVENSRPSGTQDIQITEMKQGMGYFILIAFFFSFPQCVRK